MVQAKCYSTCLLFLDPSVCKDDRNVNVGSRHFLVGWMAFRHELDWRSPCILVLILVCSKHQIVTEGSSRREAHRSTEEGRDQRTRFAFSLLRKFFFLVKMDDEEGSSRLLWVNVKGDADSFACVVVRWTPFPSNVEVHGDVIFPSRLVVVFCMAMRQRVESVCLMESKKERSKLELTKNGNFDVL